MQPPGEDDRVTPADRGLYGQPADGYLRVYWGLSEEGVHWGSEGYDDNPAGSLPRPPPTHLL